jgi:sulfite exporter TauE/SafE
VWSSLASAFVVGLLGGVHCAGMCGGIVSALTFGLPKAARSQPAMLAGFQLAYNLGRIASYVVAGALMGGLGLLLAQAVPVYLAQKVLYGVAGFIMIALGLYLGGWWFGLARVERIGQALWVRLEPLGRRLLPVQTPARAFLLGTLWGWIPCGLVYSVLVWSVSAGSVWKGAALMLAFGVGTLPNLLAIGLVAGGLARWSRKVWVRRLAGGLVMLFGCYALWQVFLV